MADIIVLNEITELLNSINSGITSTLSTINTNVNTVKTNVATILTNTNTNNTASTTGTLSQKISSAISNTAATTTENASGTLSAKLTYLINRRDKTVSPSSTNIKTLSSSGTVTCAQSESASDYGGYAGTNGTVFTCYAKYSGVYRGYGTASGSVNSTVKNSDGISRVLLYASVYHVGSGTTTNHSTTITSKTINTKATVALDSATKTVDFPAQAGDRIQMYIRAESQRSIVNACSSTYLNRETTATWTDISIRGTVNEINGVTT